MKHTIAERELSEGEVNEQFKNSVKLQEMRKTLKVLIARAIDRFALDDEDGEEEAKKAYIEAIMNYEQEIERFILNTKPTPTPTIRN